MKPATSQRPPQQKSDALHHTQPSIASQLYAGLHLTMSTTGVGPSTVWGLGNALRTACRGWRSRIDHHIPHQRTRIIVGYRNGSAHLHIFYQPSRANQLIQAQHWCPFASSSSVILGSWLVARGPSSSELACMMPHPHRHRNNADVQMPPCPWTPRTIEGRLVCVLASRHWICTFLYGAALHGIATTQFHTWFCVAYYLSCPLLPSLLVYLWSHIMLISCTTSPLPTRFS
ncbi:hypothetical protein GQ44DRAFT_429978 [Phaeosphaeriaceae sp. PMI808]|nr:hypothetical protein GQ44DRAFT_429978 [Phaeosphaeriaceae sp. PMI808]